jgi:hypothetical protein
MIRALKAAAERPRGNMCPIAGVHAAAETALLKALADRGLIDAHEGLIPMINRAGRNAAEFWS